MSQLLALAVDVAVGTSAEVYALERTARLLLRLQDGFHDRSAVVMNDESMSSGQLLHIVACEVECGLQHRPFACYSHHIIVPVEESRANAPGVAHGKHLAATGHATHHIAAIVVGHRGAQHVSRLYVILYISCDVGAFHPLCLSFGEQAFDFAVKAVTHQLEGDVGVAVDAWRLTLAHHLAEYLVDVGHVEVATQT